MQACIHVHLWLSRESGTTQSFDVFDEKMEMENSHSNGIPGSSMQNSHNSGLNASMMNGHLEEQSEGYAVGTDPGSFHNSMPTPLQVLQDRWMEFDTMAVVNELATWMNPEQTFSQEGWGSEMPLGDSIWNEWQIP